MTLKIVQILFLEIVEFETRQTLTVMLNPRLSFFLFSVMEMKFWKIWKKVSCLCKTPTSIIWQMVLK